MEKCDLYYRLFVKSFLYDEEEELCTGCFEEAFLLELEKYIDEKQNSFEFSNHEKSHIYNLISYLRFRCVYDTEETKQIMYNWCNNIIGKVNLCEEKRYAYNCFWDEEIFNHGMDQNSYLLSFKYDEEIICYMRQQIYEDFLTFCILDDETFDENKLQELINYEDFEYTVSYFLNIAANELTDKIIERILLVLQKQEELLQEQPIQLEEKRKISRLEYLQGELSSLLLKNENHSKRKEKQV